MKKQNDHLIHFIRGYLEALTDIDGGLREFWATAYMIDSKETDNFEDIKTVPAKL